MKGFDWMTLRKENENLNYDDLVICIEFFNARGLEIDLHEQFCDLIAFLK